MCELLNKWVQSKALGATAILMCISKVGGAYEFSACHSSYLCNILFWKTFNCHPDNCKYVCTTSTQDGIRYINNNKYGTFDLQEEETVNSWNFSTFKRYLVYLGETTR